MVLLPIFFIFANIKLKEENLLLITLNLKI